jgi:ATP-dependent helicase/nuclease subunit B
LLVDLSAVSERLARADAGAIVVTPTRRLARSIGQAFDAWQIEHGHRTWETPRILPFAAFVASLHDSAQHDPALAGVRAPLAPFQELALWEAVIGASDVALASTAGAAQLAAEAWSLAHQWRIADRLRHYALAPDTRMFAEWAADYAQRVEQIGAIDLARLPDAVRELAATAALDAPPTILLAGFADMTPQQEALFGALATRGSRIDRIVDDRPRGDCRRFEADDARDELRAMADWVAARLAANPAARIGIVVPDLGARRRSIERELDAALAPDALLARPDRPRPYTVSLGPALSEAPPVAAALGVLRLVAGPVDASDASALLRSPYVEFGPAPARARFDFEWRCRTGRTATLEHLLAVASADPASSAVRAALEKLRAWTHGLGGRHRRCSEWAALFGAGLRAAGFPGAGSPDSSEYQALMRWHELLAEFGALDRVQGAVDLRSAVRRLGRLAAATVFQPEGGDPPIHVLGVVESIGLRFDHLWLVGMTSDVSLVQARPHPFLPLELQRAQRMPGALVDVELQRARTALDALARSAPEVVASHAARDGDRELASSPLIAQWTPCARPHAARRMFDVMPTVELDRVVDAQGSALPPGREVVGGTSTLADHSACAFRAYAKHRLGADAPQWPHDGLDAAERGELVHRVLARFWSSLPQRTRSFVAAMPVDERLAAIRRAAQQAIARVRERRHDSVGEGVLRIEKERLVALAAGWLDYELRERGEFEVVAIEDKRALAIGPLSLRGRLDRVDRLPDGRKVVIDYKTGGSKGIGAWVVPRPDEPQLPLYLVASEPDARGIAFARLRAGKAEFVALTEDEAMLPKSRVDWRREHADWSALVDAWRAELTRLATDFAAGHAAVDPKKSDTCRYCEVALLCRLDERLGDAAEAVTSGIGGDDE